MIEDLAIILIVAGIVTLVFKKLKQPLVLGYIMAGFLVSPHMPYGEHLVNKDNIHEWAEIGVMFLLFSLGLDFSFKKIVKMGAAPIIAALTVVAGMMALGYTVGMGFGWSHMNCLFLSGMLAMSSTTIIYKAYEDLGLRQQGFASLVMSVLILEDILAIVMMVMLSAIAKGGELSGGDLVMSVATIAFFLILWFVVGIYVLPLFLKNTRRIMSQETLLVVSLGLCCLMAVVSKAAGFSEAFGAFVMGSILAETLEAEKIERVVEPVKNLFGAVFFVSVGMLVDIDVLIEYWLPILALVCAIIFGQATIGTLGYFLSGQTLHTAIRCGFSMTQIGEFAFIIASLGTELDVIDDFLYPTVVAVSVITTFTTPYMIRGAEPVYHFLETHLPKAFIMQINALTTKKHDESLGATDDSNNTSMLWRTLLKNMALNTVVYTIIIFTITYLMLHYFLIFSRTVLPHWWANGVTGIVTLVLLAPFMRALVMKNVRGEEWNKLWSASALNRLPLISTVFARGFICLAFLFHICNYLARFADAIVICLAVVVILLVVLSRSIKNRSTYMEKVFYDNLRQRELAAQVKGSKRPNYADRLMERDLTMAELTIPENSVWAGQTLAELSLGKNFGVHVSSILRGNRRINIPLAIEQVFPGDKVQVIGNDSQIARISKIMEGALYPDTDPSSLADREMLLRQVTITATTPVVGKSIRKSRIREDYGLLIVGFEGDDENVTKINPDHVFTEGDIVWIVGERSSFVRFLSR